MNKLSLTFILRALSSLSMFFLAFVCVLMTANAVYSEEGEYILSFDRRKELGLAINKP